MWAKPTKLFAKSGKAWKADGLDMMDIARLLLILILPVFVFPVAAAPALTELPARIEAPELALPDIEKRIHRLSEQRGKVVLINFWATWCPPCRKEMPSLKRLWMTLKDEPFVMYAVDAGEDARAVSEFLFETDLESSFPILLDRNGDAMRQWRVPGLPTTFIVDKSGRLVHRVVGGREWDDAGIVGRIRALLKE
jgi:thiol-disulfide isomerase/thioredoxin